MDDPTRTTQELPVMSASSDGDDGWGATTAGSGGGVAQRVANRVDEAISIGGPSYRSLALSHAGSTAGDTLVALALAGTLFFSVPSTDARDKVALYLLLTVAPFALIGPVLGAALDRWPGLYRKTLLISALGRAVLAIVMASQHETIWLFPSAFGLLVLSRVHGISRNALLPLSLETPLALVAANARLAQVGVVAGAIILPIGAAANALGGVEATLAIACVMFLWATVTGRGVPSPARRSRKQRKALRRDLKADEAAERARIEARTGKVSRSRLPRTVRIAQLATAVVRLLNGFLVLLLAFAFRDQNVGALDFGALLASAGLGFGLSSLFAPRLERRLREEPMVLAALAVEAAAAFIAGQWFGLIAASVLSLAAGFAWGTAKFAFDGLLQATVRPERRGAAFTRSETVFQLAWVIGALVPTALVLPTDVGLVTAGLVALAAQVVYVAHLLMPLRDALGYAPPGDAPYDIALPPRPDVIEPRAHR